MSSVDKRRRRKNLLEKCNYFLSKIGDDVESFELLVLPGKYFRFYRFRFQVISSDLVIPTQFLVPSDVIVRFFWVENIEVICDFSFIVRKTFPEE